MSGHSKWSQIKRQKGVTDATRSRVFSRFARLIAMEAKKANGVLSAPGLATAIARAKAVNMPKDNIERAIKKGTSKDSGTLEQVVYEAYGPAGVAIIIDALTDNKNRTTQEIKHLLVFQNIELAAPRGELGIYQNRDGLYSPRTAHLCHRRRAKKNLKWSLKRLMRMRMFNGCLRMRVAMRILAIDPGYDRLGIAVVEGSASRPILLWSDCVMPPKGAAAARLAEVSRAVTEAITTYAPDALAIETLFSASIKNGVRRRRGARRCPCRRRLGISPGRGIFAPTGEARGYRLWRRG